MCDPRNFEIILWLDLCSKLNKRLKIIELSIFWSQLDFMSFSRTAQFYESSNTAMKVWYYSFSKLLLPWNTKAIQKVTQRFSVVSLVAISSVVSYLWSMVSSTFFIGENTKSIKIYWQLCEDFDTDVLTESGARHWCIMFKDSCTNVHDEDRSGRPSIVTD